VQEHGGHVGVESRRGRGTTVTVELLAAAASAMAIASGVHLVELP